MADDRLDVEHELAAPETGQEQAAATADADRLRAERDALLDRVARVQAEFENARKRAVRDQQELREFALADALGSLLPIVDSLDRALQAPAMNVEDFRNGVELIRKQLDDALGRLGVLPIEATGQAFDPRLHEAIEVVETPSAEDNQVLDELQRGYQFQDRLLRPARVRVARNPNK